MELDESYNIPFVNIEETVAQVYREGIRKLRSDKSDPDEELKIVLETFAALGQSHPSHGMGIEWALEIIPAYRNLARIVKEMPCQEGILTPLFSKYKDLLEEYKPVSPVKERDLRIVQLYGALKELEKIKGVLEDHAIDDAERLENVFQRLDELEERIGEHDKKSKDLENL